MRKIINIALTSAMFLALSITNSCFSHADPAWWAWPGQKYDIYLGSSMWSYCTIGFPAWDSSGNTYFITAAHCFRDDHGRHYLSNKGYGLYVYSPDDHNNPVGWEKLNLVDTAQNGNYLDISLVQMYDGARIRARGWPDVPTWPHRSTLGENVCLVGTRSSVARCGKVTALHALRGQSMFDPSLGLRTYMDEASYCTWHGDSGGPIFDNRGALGINTSMSWATDKDQPCADYTSDSAYTSIVDALTILKEYIPTLTIY